MFAEPRYVVEQFWPLIEADRTSRHQEGRNDAADAIESRARLFDRYNIEGEWMHSSFMEATRLARGEG